MPDQDGLSRFKISCTSEHYDETSRAVLHLSTNTTVRRSNRIISTDFDYSHLLTNQFTLYVMLTEGEEVMLKLMSPNCTITSYEK